LGADAGSVSIIGDDSTNTVNLDAATAAAGTTTDKATISLAGTVALNPEVTNNAVVENLTLSGNGAAVSYDIADASTAANTLETLTVTGDQNVTITASAAALGGIDAAADYSDTSTAGTTTVVMDIRATVDLTHVKADLIEFGTAGAAATITTANGQALGLTADVSSGAGSLTVDSTELTTGDETLNLTIEATQTTNAIVASDFEVINLTIDDGSAATTTAQTITVAALTGGASTDINISSTLDNLTLTAVTADNLIATNFAGVLTLSGSTGIDNVTGGSGNDVIVHSADTNFTLAGGAGNDSLSVTNALSSRTVTYDGGAGTDTLEINNVLGVADRLTMSNIEVVDFNNRAGTHDARDFSGQTFVATSTGGTNTSVTMSLANATNVDLSGITGNEAQLDFTVGATATAIATTFSGSQIKDTITTGAGDDTINGNGGADIIDGAAGADTIDGGAGADSITGGAGNDAMTGGAGSDTFVFGQTAATNGSDTVTDFTVGTVASGGDVIDTDAAITVAITNATSGTSITLATATALATEGTSIAVADNGAYFAKVASTSTIDTVAELVTALTNGGELDAVDFAVNADALLILGEDNGSTLFVYGVDNDGTAAIVAGELALLATITSSADVLDNFTTANIA
jgi:Ca2+-binding RTX toxin-like protein